MIPGETADDAVLAAQVVIEEELLRVGRLQEPDELAEDRRVDPVVVHLQVDLNRLAGTHEAEPGLARFDVDVILEPSRPHFDAFFAGPSILES